MNPAAAHDASNRPLGAWLLDAGRLKPGDVERVLRYQKEHGLRFGEAAVRLGLVSAADVQAALAGQFDYPVLAPGHLDPALVAAHAPASATVEALRALRSQLLLRWFNERRRALALVGGQPGAGCSRLCANLAVVFSQLGERTLLVDADLRAPRQHQLFRLPSGPGLADWLAGKAGPEVVGRVAGLRDLSVLPAGSGAPNPQELISREAFTDLLDELTRDYEVVLLDTPPAGVAADAQVIAARAGGGLLVLRRHHTRMGDARQQVEAFAAAGVPLVGTALAA